MKQLYDYQQKIVEKCSNFDSNALFMSMGTGKTVTSLEIYKTKPCYKILVVCLKSKIEEWKRDIKDQTNCNDFMVINFESVWRKNDYLNYVDNNTFVIVDESHKIKSWSSKISKYMLKIGKKTKYKIILTGTPQNNGYIDYFNQLRFLGWLDMTVTRFKNEYCVYHQIKDGNGVFLFPKLVGYKNTDKIDNILKKAIFLKRDMVYDQVPKFEYVSVDTNSDYKKIYKNHVLNDVIYDTPLKVLLGLRQNTYQKKGSYFKDILDSTDERVVVFYNFIVERDYIAEICEKIGKPYSIYDSTEKSLETFKNNDNAVMILNYKNGSTGINDLVLSQLCVFFSPPVSYIEYEQSKKRLDRIGQVKAPYYIHFVSGVEQKIYKSLNDKKDFDERSFANELL